MTYRIARGGQIFGPYTDAEMRQYLASGNIGLIDLAQMEGSGSWLRVGDLFPATGAPLPPVSPPLRAAAPLMYADPPDFPWWGALLLGMVTGGIFFVVWDIVEASWLKRIERGSTSLLLYIAVAVLYLFKLPGMVSTMNYNMFGGPLAHPHGVLGTALFVVGIVARFRFRRELQEHFNLREGVGLRLNGFWTFLLGGVYFQYHFNRINAIKRATNRSVPAM